MMYLLPIFVPKVTQS